MMQAVLKKMILSGIVAASCIGAAGMALAKDLGTFRMMFPVESVNQYHPFFIAETKGYFKEEGLEVEYQDAGGSSAAIQQVLAGNADAALPAPSAFLNAVANGHDLRWISSYQYANIFTLAATRQSGIANIADLKGKKVGVSDLAGGEVPLVQAVLAAAGLSEGDVQIVPVGDGSALTVQALQNGQVDAYSSSLFDIASIRARGIDLVTILPKEAQDFPANGVVVTSVALEKNREKYAAFLRAVAKAVVYSAAHDAEAFAEAKKIRPEEFEDEAVARNFWEAAQTLKTPPAELTDQPIGTHFMPGFKAFHDFLRTGSEQEGGLAKDVDLTKVLDSSLIPAANDFDKAAIAK
ncbi:ABC transporter substrate-binding protein [Terrihabitans sp. B22-R8]|uniref:ABC transporter substrate-binding protein n=1 Tax=Terrihabitans sp. B22-R8 TaxID=3425128 RepID=UPI00403C2BAF